MTWTNIVLAVAAILIIGVSNVATWAITRLRNGCDHYTPRHATEQVDDTAVDVTSPDIRWQVAP